MHTMRVGRQRTSFHNHTQISREVRLCPHEDIMKLVTATPECTRIVSKTGEPIMHEMLYLVRSTTNFVSAIDLAKVVADMHTPYTLTTNYYMTLTEE
jgi:hypothetical protein